MISISIHDKTKIFINLFIPLFVLLFFSCENKNHIDNIYESWIQVENSTEESSDLQQKALQDFFENYKNFRTSDIYKNMIISESYSASLTALDKAVATENLVHIRGAISELMKTDLLASQKSNSEYLYLSYILLIFATIISIILFVLFKNYEKKRNEAQQMGIYSRFMIRGMETERARISKEIHDTVLQNIKALSFKYELIETENSEKNSDLKKDLIDYTDSCITQLRTICNNLTPVELSDNSKDNNGFILAIHNLAEQFTERNGITCVFKIQDKLDVSSLNMQQSINIFRIIQESLNNIENHAQASAVSIILNLLSKENQKVLRIFITDNGKGFDYEKKSKESLYGKKHFGLSNIKNRAKDLKADLIIISEINSGTEIKLEVPLK